MQPGDKLYHTRQNRSMEKFEEVLHAWDKMKTLNCKRVGKDPSASVFERAEDYRRKRELAETFELAKSEPEKVGNIFWYLTLRKYNNKLPKEPYYEGDFPNAFKHTFFDRRKSVLEVIRRSETFGGGSLYDTTSSTMKSLGRTEREYIEKRYA